MLIGSIVTGIISFFLNSYYTGKRLGYTSMQQLRDVSKSYMLALCIAFCVYFLKFLPCSYELVIVIQIVIGIVVFFVLCELFNIYEYIEIKKIIKKR